MRAAEVVLKVSRQETAAARNRAEPEIGHHHDHEMVASSGPQENMNKVNLAASRWGTLLGSEQETLAAKAETTAAQKKEQEQEQETVRSIFASKYSRKPQHTPSSLFVVLYGDHGPA